MSNLSQTKGRRAQLPSKEDCPQARLHVKNEPVGYLQWHAWAERKSKTYDQFKCPGCGLWVVWKRKPTAVKNGPDSRDAAHTEV